MRFALFGYLALCLAATVACDDDPIVPEDLVGQYDLVATDGRPLPTILGASESCDELLVGGALSMQPDGTYSLQLDLEQDCTRGGGQVQETQMSFDGEYTLEGQDLTFTVISFSGPHSAEIVSGSASRARIDMIITDLAVTGSIELRLLRSS